MESMGLRLWGRMEGLGLEGAMDAKSRTRPGGGVCNSEPERVELWGPGLGEWASAGWVQDGPN